MITRYFALLSLLLSCYLQAALSLKFFASRAKRYQPRAQLHEDEDLFQPSSIPVIEKAIFNLSIERLKFVLSEASDTQKLIWLNDFISQNQAGTFVEMYEKMSTQEDKHITKRNGPVEVHFSLSIRSIAEKFFESKNYIIDALVPTLKNIPKENADTMMLACILCQNGYS
jgi:hypothetical protein